jgi:hypothetical protein
MRGAMHVICRDRDEMGGLHLSFRVSEAKESDVGQFSIKKNSILTIHKPQMIKQDYGVII